MLLPDDASPLDAEVVRLGLLDDEAAWLERRRRHFQEAWRLAVPTVPAPAGGGPTGVTGMDPLVSRHAGRVFPQRWSALAERLPSIMDVDGDQSVRLSRGDLAGLAAESRSREEWLPLFVPAYAWGWGTNARGPVRPPRVLSGKPDGGRGGPAPDRDRTERRLAAAVEALAREGTNRGMPSTAHGSGGGRGGRLTGTASISLFSAGRPSNSPVRVETGRRTLWR